MPRDSDAIALGCCVAWIVVGAWVETHRHSGLWDAADLWRAWRYVTLAPLILHAVSYPRTLEIRCQH